MLTMKKKRGRPRKEKRNDKLIKLVKSGKSYTEAGNKFGISKQMVGKIMKRYRAEKVIHSSRQR